MWHAFSINTAKSWSRIADAGKGACLGEALDRPRGVAPSHVAVRASTPQSTRPVHTQDDVFTIPSRNKKAEAQSTLDVRLILEPRDDLSLPCASLTRRASGSDTGAQMLCRTEDVVLSLCLSLQRTHDRYGT